MRKELTVLAASVVLLGATALPATAIPPLPMDATITTNPDGTVLLNADTDPVGPVNTTPQPSTTPRPPRNTSSSSGTGTRPTKTKAQVREEMSSQIRLTKPKIGASPCTTETGACEAIVGVPVWLWVDEGDGQLPSDSATASAGPFTISAKAEVVQVKWSLGDGQSTVCSGTGKAFEPSDGWSTPDCGFAKGWTKPGTYTLTATYVWRVTWTGDETGTTTQAMSSTRDVTVGELQSVVTDH